MRTTGPQTLAHGPPRTTLDLLFSAGRDMVATVQCHYLAPLRYDSEFVVRTWIKELRRRTITFAYELLDLESEKVYAQGETTHVVTDQEGKPKSLPERYGKLLMESK